jgi:molybdenum cofactor biosynthesis protein MoaC
MGHNSKKIIDLPITDRQKFQMIDVGRKRSTHRRAVACGCIYMNKDAYEKVKGRSLPKGDALALAEVAAIMGAKKTPDLLPMCHPLPLDQVKLYTELHDDDCSVTVYCLATAFAKTGVEMEAIAGVNAGLMTIWDLTKGTDPALQISDIRLLAKEGGKSGLWINPMGIPEWLADQLKNDTPMNGIKVSVVIMSDRAASGDYEDKSGPVLQELLKNAGADTGDVSVIPDDKEIIVETINDIISKDKADLIIMSGGTGLGPRDVTPDMLEDICDRMIPGFGELLRQDGANFTNLSWLSRSCAGIVGQNLIITLPGSPKAVREGMEAIMPILPHAMKMAKGEGHE